VEVEDKDECYHRISEGLSLSAIENSRAGSPDDEGKEHAHGRPKEQGTTTQSVHQHSGTASCNKIEYLEQPIDQGLGIRVSDPDRVEDEGEIVGYDRDTL
jgi:hypothetical protein